MDYEISEKVINQEEHINTRTLPAWFFWVVGILFIGLFTYYSQLAHAGLPPTSLKGQSETSPTTTFFFQSPYNQATTTAASTRLIETGYQNLLTNPSNEHSSYFTGWSTLGATTPSRETTVVVDGKASAKLTTSAQSGNFYFQNVTPTIQLQGVNMEYGIWVKTAVSGAQVCALQAGSQVGTCTTVTGDNQWRYYVVFYPGPASGSVGVALNSVSGVTGDFYVDNAYVGLARNIGSVAQAQFIGGMEQAGASGCVYAENTSTGLTDFVSLGTGTGCNAWTVTGQVTATGTNDHRPILSNIAPGMYTIEMNGQAQSDTTNQVCNYRLSDGTTTYQPQAIQPGGASQVYTNILRWHIPYTTSFTSKTFTVQASDNQGGSCNITNVNSGFNISWKIYYFPSANQTVANVTQSEFNETDCPTITGSWNTNTTYTCKWYRRKNRAYFDVYVTLSGAPNSATLQINNPSGIVVDTSKLSNSVSADTMLFGQGTTLDAGVASYAVRVNYNGTTSVAASVINAAGTYGVNSGLTQAVPFTYGAGDSVNLKYDFPVVGWVDNPLPVTTGSVISGSTGGDRIERAKFNCGPSSVVSSQSSTWINGITNISGGQCDLTLPAGTFSGAPTCTVSMNQADAAVVVMNEIMVTSATTMTYVCRVVSNGSSTVNNCSNVNANIICMGPR